MPFRATRFRPVFGLVLTGVVAAVAVAALVALAFGGGLPELLRYGALPVLAAALCAAMFWSPRLEIDDHAVVVRNVLRTVEEGCAKAGNRSLPTRNKEDTSLRSSPIRA